MHLPDLGARRGARAAPGWGPEECFITRCRVGTDKKRKNAETYTGNMGIEVNILKVEGGICEPNPGAHRQRHLALATQDNLALGGTETISLSAYRPP